jgi:hypothetical protein
MTTRIGRAAVMGAVLTMFVSAGIAFAHEERTVSDYGFVVGLIDEPVYTGQKSGLEFLVTEGDTPVEGLEATLQGTVTFGGETRELPLEPRFGEPGWYESVFFPTAAGPYTFRIFGDIDGTAVDESFTSSPDGFSEVQDVTGGQFPVTLPAAGDTARDAREGAAAAGTATLALVLGGAGLLAGLVALGLTLARSRP